MLSRANMWKYTAAVISVISNELSSVHIGPPMLPSSPLVK